MVLLSSCADKAFIADYPVPANEIASPVSSISTDQELLLVEAESEQLLTEELEALRHTGAWRHEKGSTFPAQKEQTTYDFPIVINKQVKAYLDLFQNGQQKQFALWLSRSGKYIPMFRKELREAGLPEDLAYLAMIESGFSQRAFSRAKAVGLWQFIKGTGKQYNLEIDDYVDERRHAEKSTKAAIAFLSDLYADFGDWHLAVAAYNAGGGKIRRGMKRYKSNDFWSLAEHGYLQMETKRYVPKLIAAILIAKNPEEYGFTDINYESPLEYDTLRVGPGLSLEAVALLCDANDKDIKRLNQELKTGKTPLNKSYYDVQIPSGSKKLAESNLPRLHSVVSTEYKTHIIAKSDTLYNICKRYNINKTALLKINNLRSSRLIAGNHLRIPYNAIQYRLLPEGKQGSLAANNLVLHKIRPGETISKIAKKYNVPADLIVSWNGLKSLDKIKAGQQLALYIEDSDQTQHHKKKTTNSIAVSTPDPDASLLVLGEQKKFSQAQPTLTPSQISWYKVREGDSLWAIAKKFNLSPEQLRSWNNLKSNRIHPGIKLKIKNV
ncbi:MAG: LysM peptidoglycan-binding domain-containing protein [Proteobacteria bacterium]|nr:LysM peptidoglycan-binding domain-containing protein [Pseudomonadota bacterium]MBU1060879.1 LysM peptidoglycan-binding domain-containing protein [Pseudomonadota bacterium]